MLLEPEERHILPLTLLWQTVFGDAPDYIALFFDGVWQSNQTFAAFESGKLVSALYLLDCEIHLDAKRYGGYYLYAAATLPDFRGRGLMSGLVREAQSFAAHEKKDFIALVPASDSLYDYYARFSFMPAMQRYVGASSASFPGKLRKISPQAYYKAAQELPCERFLWTPENHAYALACLAYAGFQPFAGDGGVLLTDAETIAEALPATPEKLPALLSACRAASAAAPFAADGLVPQRFGMVYALNDALSTALQTKTIYMNLALD